MKYKRIELNSVENLKQAERLLANGWKIIQSSIFAVLLRKDPKRKGSL